VEVTAPFHQAQPTPNAFTDDANLEVLLYDVEGIRDIDDNYLA